MIDRLKRRLRPPTPTLDSLRAYALWSASYPPQPHNPLMQTEERAVLAMLPDVTGKRCADLGSGSGRYGLLLAERGARSVIALDTSPHMLARNPLSVRAIAPLHALPIASGSVDVIVCGMTIGHTPRLAESIAEIGRVLAAGGVAIVSDFHPVQHFTGARRTFQADGVVYAVEHYPHLYADHHAAAVHAGLGIDAIAEPRLHAEGAPVVLVLRFYKPG